jgi:hypothetical protein
MENKQTNVFFKVSYSCVSKLTYTGMNKDNGYTFKLLREWDDMIFSNVEFEFTANIDAEANIQVDSDGEFLFPEEYKAIPRLVSEDLFNKQGIKYWARRCDVTGKGMDEGFCFGDGWHYIADDEDALSFVRKQGYASLEESYEDDNHYWTEWYDDEPQFVELQNGTLKTLD